MSPIEQSVYVIPESTAEVNQASKRQRTDPGDVWIDVSEFCAQDVEPVETKHGVSDEIPSTGSSRVSNQETDEAEDHLRSTIISTDVIDKYKDGVAKLKSELAALDLEDHLWHLESYDFNGVGVV
jgi:hypothetical protein